MPDSNQESPARAETRDVAEEILRTKTTPAIPYVHLLARAYLDSEAKLVALREALTAIKNYRGAPYVKEPPERVMRKLAISALAASEEKGE